MEHPRLHRLALARLRLVVTSTRIAVYGAILGFLAFAHPCSASTAGSVLLTLGVLDAEDYSRPQLGIDLSTGPRRWPMRISSYAAVSHEVLACVECSSADETTVELGVGLEGVLRASKLQGRLGAGPAWGRDHIDIEGDDSGGPSHYDHDRTGWWVRGLAVFRPVGHLGIGGGARYSRLGDSAVELESWTFFGTVGWLWPGGE
jgi:hypothetical protein